MGAGREHPVGGAEEVGVDEGGERLGEPHGWRWRVPPRCRRSCAAGACSARRARRCGTASRRGSRDGRVVRGVTRNGAVLAQRQVGRLHRFQPAELAGLLQVHLLGQGARRRRADPRRAGPRPTASGRRRPVPPRARARTSKCGPCSQPRLNWTPGAPCSLSARAPARRAGRATPVSPASVCGAALLSGRRSPASRQCAPELQPPCLSHLPVKSSTILRNVLLEFWAANCAREEREGRPLTYVTVVVTPLQKSRNDRFHCAQS